MDSTFGGWNFEAGGPYDVDKYGDCGDYSDYLSQQIRGPDNCARGGPVPWKQNQALENEYRYSNPRHYPRENPAYAWTDQGSGGALTRAYPVYNPEQNRAAEIRGDVPYYGCRCGRCTGAATARTGAGMRLETIEERAEALGAGSAAQPAKSEGFSPGPAQQIDMQILLFFLFLLLVVVCSICLKEFASLKSDVNMLHALLQAKIAAAKV